MERRTAEEELRRAEDKRRREQEQLRCAELERLSIAPRLFLDGLASIAPRAYLYGVA